MNKGRVMSFNRLLILSVALVGLVFNILWSIQKEKTGVMIDNLILFNAFLASLMFVITFIRNNK